jgi:hypothetical protein
MRVSWPKVKLGEVPISAFLEGETPSSRLGKWVAAASAGCASKSSRPVPPDRNAATTFPRAPCSPALSFVEVLSLALGGARLGSRHKPSSVIPSEAEGSQSLPSKPGGFSAHASLRASASPREPLRGLNTPCHLTKSSGNLRGKARTRSLTRRRGDVEKRVGLKDLDGIGVQVEDDSTIRKFRITRFADFRTVPQAPPQSFSLRASASPREPLQGLSQYCPCQPATASEKTRWF